MLPFSMSGSNIFIHHEMKRHVSRESARTISGLHRASRKCKVWFSRYINENNVQSAPNTQAAATFYTMADPAAKVPPGLLSHVHLVSQYQFPFHGSPLALDTALEHLLQAPRIVRELSPVAWQFLTPLKDGTLLLMWQPSSHLQNTYATDGYIWADPERQFLQDCKGYVSCESILLDKSALLTSCKENRNSDPRNWLYPQR